MQGHSVLGSCQNVSALKMCFFCVTTASICVCDASYYCHRDTQTGYINIIILRAGSRLRDCAHCKTVSQCPNQSGSSRALCLCEEKTQNIKGECDENNKLGKFLSTTHNAPLLKLSHFDPRATGGLIPTVCKSCKAEQRRCS